LGSPPYIHQNFLVAAEGHHAPLRRT